MHDALSFELNGKPAAVIVEDVFMDLAAGKTKMMGLPEFKPLEIKHPMRSVEDGRTKGKELVEEAIKWLTKSSS